MALDGGGWLIFTSTFLTQVRRGIRSAGDAKQADLDAIFGDMDVDEAASSNTTAAAQAAGYADSAAAFAAAPAHVRREARAHQPGFFDL